jgi:hypothetical protein
MLNCQYIETPARGGAGGHAPAAATHGHAMRTNRPRAAGVLNFEDRATDDVGATVRPRAFVLRAAFISG